MNPSPMLLCELEDWFVDDLDGTGDERRIGLQPRESREKKTKTLQNLS